MTLWRVILAFLGVTFAGVGFAFITNPDQMAAIATLTLSTPAARTDVRAMYGGLEFGIGIFLLICAFRREFVRVGLFAGACALISMATARTVGLMLDGFDILQFMVALSEWMGGGLATWGALAARPEADVLPAPLKDPTPDAPAVPVVPVADLKVRPAVGAVEPPPDTTKDRHP